jgi:hypothetical protein
MPVHWADISRVGSPSVPPFGCLYIYTFLSFLFPTLLTEASGRSFQDSTTVSLWTRGLYWSLGLSFHGLFMLSRSLSN